MGLLKAAAAAAFLSFACSTTPAITVVATPGKVPGDGSTTITVAARPTEGGIPVEVPVHLALEVSGGLGAPAGWDGATGDPARIDVTSADGVATATLKAPRQGFGTVKVTASFSSQGVEPSATALVALQPGGAGAVRLSFTCLHQNVGALVHGRLSDLHVLCRATAIDASGRPIPHASVQTLSEAGSLSWHDDQDGAQQFVYTVRPGDAPPRDVDPLDSTGREEEVCPSACNANPFQPACQGEPCWTDAAGLIHNPRDGIVTLVAAAPGSPGEVDALGEPFVDANDNGVRDPGEPFIDYDGDGKYRPGDGKAHEHMVWKAFRIIWSGESAATATGAAATTHDAFIAVEKTDATHATATLRLFDRNLNQLAADGPSNGDGIAWSSSCANGGSVTFAAGDQLLEQRDPGVLFAADTGAIATPQLRSAWTRQTDYDNALTWTEGASPDECRITAAPHRAYDPGAAGFEPAGSDPDAAVTAAVTF